MQIDDWKIEVFKLANGRQIASFQASKVLIMLLIYTNQTPLTGEILRTSIQRSAISSSVISQTSSTSRNGLTKTSVWNAKEGFQQQSHDKNSSEIVFIRVDKKTLHHSLLHKNRLVESKINSATLSCMAPKLVFLPFTYFYYRFMSSMSDINCPFDTTLALGKNYNPCAICVLIYRYM